MDSLPGEFDLHGPLDFEGGQGRQMLHRHILLAAEAAAHQLVLHHDALRGPAQHDGDLLPGVIDPLIPGVDLHAVPVGEGHGALGLQKGVLGERRAEAVADHIAGAGQGGPWRCPG